MQKALLIAEKPDLMRKIEDAYNKHISEFNIAITFMAQRGHLFGLKWPNEIDKVMEEWSWDNLPFYPEEHGGWQYKVNPEKKTGNFKTSMERFKEIQAEYKSGNYDFIIHAGDPDREGELLIAETLMALGNKLPVKRFWSNDVTENAIVNALKNLKDDDNDPFLVNLRASAFGRQHADYIMGMNLSRAATMQMKGRAAVGRVKTPILAIVCKRELDIQNFKPTTSYGVKANYSEGFDGQYYVAPIETEDNEEEDNEKGLIYFNTKTEAEEFINSLKNKAAVISFETKRTTQTAPKLFKLATAQIEAGKAGYSADKTLEIIQSLYDKTYISYPRTDCEYISSNEDLKALLSATECDSSLTPFIRTIDTAAIDKVKKTKKYVNDKELQAHGHSGLVPTANKPDFDKLTKDEQFIYDMIARRFVAIFLPPLIQNKTILLADNNGSTFKSNGKTLIDAGYTKIFDTNFSDNEIPVHKEGDILNVSGFEVVEKTTKCPTRFTSATLVAACENPKKYLDDENLKKTVKELHIGTPATRASIISGLEDIDKYTISKKEGKKEYIYPTDNGMKLYQNIKTTMICRVDMTAKWDMMLEEIREGILALKDFENKIKVDNEALIDEFKNTQMTSLSANQYATVGKCPKCGADVLSGKKGFFCSSWKKDGSGCDFSVYGFVCESKISDKEMSALLKGDEIVKKIKNKGKTWEQKLKLNTESWKLEFINENANFTSANTGLQCPLCGKEVITTPWGYKCEGYEKDNPAACKFSIGEICSVKLSEDDLADLIINKKTRLIDGFVSPKKKTKFVAYLTLSETGIKFEFPTEEAVANEAIKTCPKCGADMISSKFDYHCSNEACDVRLSKYVCKKWIPDNEIEKIFTKGKSGLIKGLQGKSKKFDAYLKWNQGSSYEFEFPQRKAK